MREMVGTGMAVHGGHAMGRRKTAAAKGMDDETWTLDRKGH